MTPERLQDLAYWRDGQLVKRHGNEGAAFRLKGIGLAPALAITPPSAEELKWTGLDGYPLNPDHPCWREART